MADNLAIALKLYPMGGTIESLSDDWNLTEEEIEMFTQAVKNDWAWGIHRERRTNLPERRGAKPMEKCSAKVHHGPGHQSSTRCVRKGLHVIHHAEVMGEAVDWEGDDYFDS